MRERATADRGFQAKRIWETQQKEKQKRQYQHREPDKRKAISLEQARAQTRIAEASVR
jgi:hypothetical protein